MTVEPAAAPAATTTPLRTRPFGGPADLVRMQALQREGWRRLGPIAESHPGDLEWWMHGLSDPQDDQSARICLWESDGGELRGCSWIFRGELQWFVHPDERDGELRQQMLEWHAITLGEVFETSDVPGGVVNLISGLKSELVPWLASHMDVNAIDITGVDDESAATKVRATAAENVKRVVHWSGEWTDARNAQSPYAIFDFQEMKTVWHPMGM